MKCFTHTDSDAVGSCKHCAKGTCSVCAVDTGHGLACSVECAEHVKLLAVLMQSTSAATKINRGGAAYVMPAFLLFMGVVFVGQALFSGRTGQSLTFAVVLGSVFVVFGALLGLIQYVWHKRSAAASAI